MHRILTNFLIRFFDILFSSLAILVLLPFMIPIMIALKLTGEHDIFYAQMRVGKGEKEFPILKLATMLRNSPNLPGGLFTQKNDPRMLPMGKFLRKTKINELPQLWNIFKGDMSVIGYRPMVPVYYAVYPEADRKVLSGSKPGLSGIGSIVFRSEEELMRKVDDQEKYYQEVIVPYKSALECWYVRHKSVVLYFRLIWMTVVAVLQPSNKDWVNLPDLPPMPEELQKLMFDE